jgi:hypothetical protein
LTLQEHATAFLSLDKRELGEAFCDSLASEPRPNASFVIRENTLFISNHPVTEPTTSCKHREAPCCLLLFLRSTGPQQPLRNRQPGLQLTASRPKIRSTLAVAMAATSVDLGLFSQLTRMEALFENLKTQSYPPRPLASGTTWFSTTRSYRRFHKFLAGPGPSRELPVQAALWSSKPPPHVNLIVKQTWGNSLRQLELPIRIPVLVVKWSSGGEMRVLWSRVACDGLRPEASGRPLGRNPTIDRAAVQDSGPTSIPR